MPAFTAPLQSLASKMVKSRHSLHATNLQCEGGRTECDKARQQVEANDAEIAALEEEERKLKLRYVESKLAYEKMHALKYARQQELKAIRQQKVSVGKEAESIGCTYDAQRCEWTKAHEEHVRVEQQAYSLSDKLEVVEKDKDLQRRRAQQHRDELTRFACCRLVRVRATYHFPHDCSRRASGCSARQVRKDARAAQARAGHHSGECTGCLVRPRHHYAICVQYRTYCSLSSRPGLPRVPCPP